ncbi:hypothetical protein CL631_00390 [bacterium]|nr:hypothetical protein [bacterium]
MKVKVKELSKKDRIETLDALYTAASTLKGREAMKLFLRDLLTESERIMLGRRILIARELLAGATYDSIMTSLKVGPDTVWRVHRWLLDQAPGYEEAIKNMREEVDKREEKRRIGGIYTDQNWSGVVARLKYKYPIHFLLFPWPKEHRKRRHKQISRKSKRS